jgi:signal transduction histidine kinase
MVINNETDRLTALVGDLLDISRIESGKFEIELGPVALSDIIYSVSKDLENKCKRHQIVIGIPSRLPPLLADEDKMVQVFLNLLDNAIKFSPEGGKIFVSAVVEEKMLKCDITDQGIGIDEENIPHVFKKFYRVDNSDLYEIAGTGLGLPIVKHIIESLGGEIKVKSELGKGSTFTLWLPLVSN